RRLFMHSDASLTPSLSRCLSYGEQITPKGTDPLVPHLPLAETLKPGSRPYIRTPSLRTPPAVVFSFYTRAECQRDYYRGEMVELRYKKFSGGLAEEISQMLNQVSLQAAAFQSIQKKINVIAEECDIIKTVDMERGEALRFLERRVKQLGRE